MTASASAAAELVWPVAGLRRGERGPAVKRLQEWLCLHRCATAIDGDYGPATSAQVLAFQRRERPTAPSGIADAATLAALSRPLARAFGFDCEARSLRAAVLAIAAAHLAQHPREVGGDNRGPWVRAYCEHDGGAYRWCAGFVMSIVRQACAALDQSMPVPFTLSCDYLAARARHAGRLTHDPARVRPGDIGLCYRGSGDGKDWFHAYLITAVHVDFHETAEGNTNDEGSANGYEACARTRGLAAKDYVLLG